MAKTKITVTSVEARFGGATSHSAVWDIQVMRTPWQVHSSGSLPDAQDLPQDVREGLRRWLNGTEDVTDGDAGSTKL